MAFALKNNNILGTGSLPSPSGQLASQANFIDPYSYAMQYSPDLLEDLHLQSGKGKILKFAQITGSEKPFASDEVRHAELGTLHRAHDGVTVSGTTFTTTTPHNLRVGDEIQISDGTIEKQAFVKSITSTTVFEADNKTAGAFGFAGAVTLYKYSNSWAKGTENFTQGREDNPIFIRNTPKIIKEFYNINESDMAHHVWLKAPQYAGGEGWYNNELDRTFDEYDNMLEMTHMFDRKVVSGSDADLAGKPKGFKGIIQQVEERGNIGNEYIEDIEELSAIAKRIKQQGGTTSYTVWCDHTQMAKFRQMMSGANAHYSTGANFGIFSNSQDKGKNMALNLDFDWVKVDGITFFFTELKVLDDPQLLGAGNFNSTSLASMFVPAGEKSVLEDGNYYNAPFLLIRYRKMGGINRYRKIEFFGGVYGTPHKIDTMEMHVKTEMTNQVIGANQWLVNRRGTGIYTGS